MPSTSLPRRSVPSAVHNTVTAVAEAMARARALSASKVNIRGSSRPMVSSMLTRKRDRRSLDKNAGLRIGFPSFPQRLPQSGYAPCGVT